MEHDRTRLTYYLARGLRCNGQIYAQGVVHLDGIFVGDIQGEGVVVIGQHAKIESNIEVDTVIIAGTFLGTILSKKRVSITHSSTVRGTIHAPICDIEHGARIYAQLNIRNKQ